MIIVSCKKQNHGETAYVGLTLSGVIHIKYCRLGNSLFVGNHSSINHVSNSHLKQKTMSAYAILDLEIFDKENLEIYSKTIKTFLEEVEQYSSAKPYKLFKPLSSR